MQNKIKQFHEKYKFSKTPTPPLARMADVASEVGELSKEVLSSTNYGSTDFAITDKFTMELGDCLYALLTLAEETGVDANLALDTVLEKYKRRIAKHGNMGSKKEEVN